MAKATVDVSLRADIKQLVDSLAEVQGVTKKEAGKMVREMRKGYKEQVKAAQVAAKLQQKAIKATGKQTEKTTEHTLDVLQKSASEMSAVFGVGLLGDLEGVFDIARVSSERFGVGAAAAFAGAAGAAAIGVAAVVQYTETQQALNREIAASAESLEGFVSPAFLEALQSFSEEMQLIDRTTERLAAESLVGAADQALQLEQHIVAITSVGLPKWVGGVTHAFEEWSKQINLINGDLIPLRLLVQKLTGAVSDAGAELVEETRELADSAKASEEVEKATRRATVAKRESVKVTREMKDAARLANDSWKGFAGDLATFNKLEAEVNRDLMSSGDLHILKLMERRDAIARLAEKYPEMSGATEVLTKADQRLREEVTRLNEELDEQNGKIDGEKFKKLTEDLNLAAQATAHLADAMSTFAGLALDRFSELADSRRRAEEDRIDREAERHKQQVANLLAEGRISQSVADARNKNIDRNASSGKRAIKGLSREETKAAKRAFAVQQAAAVSGVIMTGAEAYLSFLAAFAPLLVGAPFAAASIVGPAVLAQLAVIASQKPPEFPAGGAVSPDHMVIGVQRDEGVVSRRGMAALGGPAALDQINRGVSSGTEIQAQIVLDRRVIGRAIASLMPQTRTNRPIGQVPIYGVR